MDKRHTDISLKRIDRFKKPMKRYSTSLAIREMQIKNIMGYHYITIGMDKIKK